MKSFLRILILLGLAAWWPAGLAAPTDDTLVTRVNLDYASSYSFRGVPRAGASLQSAMELDRGGFSGGLWTNQSIGRGEERETNLNAAYRWPVSDAVAVSVSLGQTWYGDVPGGGVTQSREVGVTASYSAIAGFTPGLAYFHDFRFQADTTEATVGRSIALTGLGAFLELNAYMGWARGGNWRPDAPGAPLADGYGYWGGEIRLPYRIGLHSTVVVGAYRAASFARSATQGPFGRGPGQQTGLTVGVNLDF